MASETLKPLLPDFVRTCRTLDVFWPYIKGRAGTYADRRHIIGTAFVPLLDLNLPPQPAAPYTDKREGLRAVIHGFVSP